MLVAVGAVGGGAALAVASVPDSGGVIHACMHVTTAPGGAVIPDTTAPNLTIIDPSAGQGCTSPAGAVAGQTAISWNVAGPPGPAGPPGVPRTPSAPADPDATGRGVTNTFTITPPALKSNAALVGEVTLGSGRTALTFNILTSSSAADAKARTHDLIITKPVDVASPKLFEATVKGTHIKSGRITLRKAGRDPLRLVIKLTDVLISSDQTEASPGKDSAPTETLSLNFTKIEFKYTQQKVA